MPAHDFLKMSEQELLTRADKCLERADSALEVPPSHFDEHTRLRLFLEAQSCLAEVLRRQAERTADQDRSRNEKIANRDFWMEVGVMVLIGIEIILSVIGLRAGYQQGEVLDKQTTALMHMDTSTAATSDSLQKLVAAQDASLKILQQEQAERAKKPRLTLYAGNIPLERASIHPKPRTGSAQTVASLDLLLKNEGDAPVSTFRLHALVPGDVILESNPLLTVPEYEPSTPRAGHIVTLQLAPLTAGQTVRTHMEIFVPNGHALFKIPFTVDALELQAVTPLGSLTVLPPKP